MTTDHSDGEHDPSPDGLSQRGNGAGFPREALESLIKQAEREFAARAEEHGPGKNWAGTEPRWDIQKAVDEQFSMRDPAQDGNYDTAERYAANSLNHLLFALENTDG